MGAYLVSESREPAPGWMTISGDVDDARILMRRPGYSGGKGRFEATAPEVWEGLVAQALTSQCIRLTRPVVLPAAVLSRQALICCIFAEQKGPVFGRGFPFT